MIWLLLALQAADGLLTWYGIDKLGAREANPIVLWLIDRIGLGPALVVVKGAGMALSFYAATHFPFAAVALVAVYVAVVINNLRIIRAKEDS